MSKYIEYDDELLPIDEALDKLDNDEKEEEIDNLNNVIRELEIYLKETMELSDENDDEYKLCRDIMKFLERLKEKYSVQDDHVRCEKNGEIYILKYSDGSKCYLKGEQ